MSDDLLEYRLAGRYRSSNEPWRPVEPGRVWCGEGAHMEFRRTPLPSAAALLAYLETAGWAMSPPEGWSAATLNEPTGEVIVVRQSDTPEAAAVKIARAEGRTPAEVMAAIRALQEAPNSHAGAPADDESDHARPAVPDGSHDRREALGRLAHETYGRWLLEQVPKPWDARHLARWGDLTADLREFYMRAGAALAADERERLRIALRDHYLAEVICDHGRKLDNPVCACSRVFLGWHPSVGAAVEAWIGHVLGAGEDTDEPA